MRDPIVVGLAAAIGLFALPVVLWFAAAWLIGGDHCLWIAGLGGCLPI